MYLDVKEINWNKGEIDFHHILHIPSSKELNNN